MCCLSQQALATRFLGILTLLTLNDLESPKQGVFVNFLPYLALVMGFLGLSALMTLNPKMCFY